MNLTYRVSDKKIPFPEAAPRQYAPLIIALVC
jgi:hypothetical protein